MLFDQDAEAAEDALGLIDLFRRSFDVDEVAAGRQTNAERLADHTQMLIAAAEQVQRFIAVVESQGDRSFGVHGVAACGLAHAKVFKGCRVR